MIIRVCGLEGPLKVLSYPTPICPQYLLAVTGAVGFEEAHEERYLTLKSRWIFKVTIRIEV